MNQLLSKIGAIIVTVTVFLFAVFIVCDFSFGSYFVCMFLPLGYIMMSAGFQHESAEKTKVSANIGLILAGVYAVLILVVYYAQTTTVRVEKLNNQAAKVLNYQNYSHKTFRAASIMGSIPCAVASSVSATLMSGSMPNSV